MPASDHGWIAGTFIPRSFLTPQGGRRSAGPGEEMVTNGPAVPHPP